ncbi:unnamed protein product, partial [Amoebophrya sp. A25]|eukprot:GSA25T00013345001.1
MKNMSDNSVAAAGADASTATIQEKTAPMTERFAATILLHVVGDALGYKGGEWEFCASTSKIRNDCEALGGMLALDIKNW